MWVPQFIKAPGQDGGVVDDRNWEQVDLLPTVADLVGIQVPWTTEGSSQTGEATRTRTEKWWYDVPGHRKVRDGPANWKVVLAGETDTLVRGADGVRGLYRFGAAADLVYRDPASVGPVGGDLATAALDDGRLFATIEPGSGKVPALISGRLTSPAGGRLRAGRRQRPHRRRVEPVPRASRRAGGQVRHHHPRLPVEGRRRPPPAPALPARPRRRPAAPATGRGVVRVAAER